MAQIDSANQSRRLVSILMTTYDSAQHLEPCLESIFQQDYPALEIVVVDNASTDGTRDILKRHEDRLRVIYNSDNVGFAGGQNQAIARASGDWLLSLNPDVILSPDFVSKLVCAGEADPRVGVVCGKLLRWKPQDESARSQVVDSTGIYFLRNLRHLDRGAEEMDRGQYDRPEYVFGATGAAALYRREMVTDISVQNEFFDEDFFAYREDADLAWRAQMMGWRCLYTPDAVAWHVRRVTPERFHQLPRIINWHSIKNRFLMRAKNISPELYGNLFIPITVRDSLILGYGTLRDPGLLSGLGVLWTRRAAIRQKRAWIQGHRRVSDAELARWFSDEPRAFPIDAGDNRHKLSPTMTPPISHPRANKEGGAAAICAGVTTFFLFLFALAQPVSIAGAEIAYSTAALAWVIRMALVKHGGLRRSPLDLPILFYLIFCAASAAVSPLPASSWEGIRKVSLIFLALLVAHNVATARRAKQLLALLFLSGLVSVAWGAWQYAFGVGLLVHNPAHNSAFFQAGVHDGDVIMRVDDRLIRHPADFVAYLNTKPTALPLNLRVVHGGDIAVLKGSVPLVVPPGQWPRAANANQLGMQIQTARPARALAFYSHYQSDAYVLELMASVAFGLWIGSAELFSATALLMAAVFLALAFAEGMTLTGGAWIALALGCAIQAWFRFGRWFARIALPFVVVLAIIGTAVARLRLRGEGLFDLRDPGTDYRLLMWRDGLRLIREHPLFGVGMNVVRDAWWQFDLAAYKKYGLRLHFHSTPIQIAVESGLPALIAWLALMICYLVMLVRLVLRARDHGTRFQFGLSLGVLGGTIGFLAGSVVQYDYGDSVVVLLFWFLMGLALATLYQLEDAPASSKT